MIIPGEFFSQDFILTEIIVKIFGQSACNIKVVSVVINVGNDVKIAYITAKKSKKRKPGTGCISKVSKNTWQGKYTPRGKDGKREQHIVYAKSEEECEVKLREMIEKLKSNEITIA